MLTSSSIEVIEGQEFYIILKGEGVGGYSWVVEEDTFFAFHENILNISYSDSGYIKYFKIKFSSGPPFHRLIFEKVRMWEDKVAETREFFITVYPRPSDAVTV